jgi:hypothetical protein
MVRTPSGTANSLAAADGLGPALGLAVAFADGEGEGDAFD